MWFEEKKKEKAFRSGILSWNWQRAAVKPQLLWLGKWLMTPPSLHHHRFFGFTAKKKPRSPDAFGLRWQRKGRHRCGVSLASGHSKSTAAGPDQGDQDCAERCKRWVCGWLIGANQRWAVRLRWSRSSQTAVKILLFQGYSLFAKLSV